MRTNITEASDPSTWQVVIPEDKKNLLSSASALKVLAARSAIPCLHQSCTQSVSGGMASAWLCDGSVSSCHGVHACHAVKAVAAVLHDCLEALVSFSGLTDKRPMQAYMCQSWLFCTARAQGDALVVTYMRDVATILQLHSLSTGALVRELPMPGYGSIKEFCGRPSLSQFYYSFQSMTDPGSTYT